MLYLDICPHIKRWNKITKILSFLLCFSLTGQKPPSRNVDEFLSLLWSWKKKKLIATWITIQVASQIFKLETFWNFLLDDAKKCWINWPKLKVPKLKSKSIETTIQYFSLDVISQPLQYQMQYQQFLKSLKELPRKNCFW